MTHRLLALISTLAPLMACLGCEPPVEGPMPSIDDPAAWMVEHADAYLSDRSQRRAWIESSLWVPELPYARKRLDAYALPAGGWDALPEMHPRSAPVPSDPAVDDAMPSERSPEWVELPTDPPTDLAGWRALGERVFHTLPMRRDAYMEWLVERPALWPRAGLTVEDGAISGLTRFVDWRGEDRVGITCALCHRADGMSGRAARGLDLGWVRARYDESRGRAPGVWDGWGPGQVDVTDDRIDDPLAIADLWTVPWQSHLNTSGAVRLDSPAALAIRFETQYITGHAFTTRPPRALMWALAIYVLTLDRPTGGPPPGHPGADVFAERCAGCHVPERGYAGDLVAPDGFIGDTRPAFSPMRGTGWLKVPGLIGIGAGGPYLHDGRFETLQDLVGAGHPFGQPPDAADAAALVDFLRAL